MEAFSNIAASVQGGAANVDWGAVFKTSNLSPRVQTHLARVYGTLASALAATVVGVAADIRFSLGGILSTIGMVMIMFILLLDQDKANWQKRVSLLATFGFLQGCSLGPLVNLAIHIDPAIVVTALLGTATVFVCFSLSAIYSPRRSYLFLGGMIASATTFLCVLSLVSLFWRPVFMYSVHLYVGLAIWMAYVIFDTQIIIEKADAGSNDFVWHALELFIDFIAIFVRLLVILMQNSQKREGKKRSNNRR